MCYHYSLKAETRELERRYLIEIEDSLGFDPFVHVSCFVKPSPLLPVITNEKPRTLQLFKWGLIPFWAKEQDLSYNTANAKMEGIESKPSWRLPIRSKRCLVPATGFFEWRHIGKDKYPYFISLNDKQVFSMAGIWDSWICKDTGEIVNSFSLITASANSLMEKIHNTKKRMPVILSRQDEESWLNIDIEIQEALALLKQYPSVEMKAHTIRKDFFRLGGNSLDVVEAFEYPELVLLN
ncbi:MAG TPA: SOS response-associated peptidase [Flavobacteriales bacterium]|nr:SOS response-associated peptidase [Flavobacteriales bacterium]